MTKKKEEWQDPDSGYLNCISVGDTYVKKQIKQIQTCLMCHFCANKQKSRKFSSYFNQ